MLVYSKIMWFAILIPFLGTTLGSGCVFLFKNIGKKIDKVLSGFAAGVMIAASMWSLLIPAMEQAEQNAGMGKLSFVPAACGFLLGIGFLLLIDVLVPHLHVNSGKPEGLKSSLSKHAMMLLAVTIHNIPEGMAVGVVYAAMLTEGSGISYGAAFALAAGIAIQNFPEGAILSLPLHQSGMKKRHAFLFGSLSGIVEPVSTVLVILLSSFFTPILPYCLSFAAGAMMYVVVEELIPEMSEGEHSNIGVIAFSLGFVLMMILDVVFG